MGGFIGIGRAPLRRRRRRRVVFASSLRAADEKRRGRVIALLNQALAEAEQTGEVVAVISCNETKGVIWRYGEFISPESIAGCLHAGTDVVIGQGNWRELSPIRRGYLVPREKFEPNQKGWVFLVGIKISHLEETDVYVSFQESI